ncbi:MAG: hypothetical protein ACXWIN_03780 [Burkholderiaceae bacterium]
MEQAAPQVLMAAAVQEALVLAVLMAAVVQAAAQEAVVRQALMAAVVLVAAQEIAAAPTAQQTMAWERAVAPAGQAIQQDAQAPTTWEAVQVAHLQAQAAQVLNSLDSTLLDSWLKNLVSENKEMNFYFENEIIKIDFMTVFL